MPAFGTPGVDSESTLREMVKHLKSYYMVSLIPLSCGVCNTSQFTNFS